MGNTILDDSLDSNRWDYVYSIQLPNTSYIKSKLQLYFIDERLSYFEGDYAPTEVHVERAKQAAPEKTELSEQTDKQSKQSKQKRPNSTVVSNASASLPFAVWLA